MNALARRLTEGLITYEQAIEQAGLEPDEVERNWLLHDLKNSREVQRAVMLAVITKLHATGKYDDDDLLEFARCLKARNPGLWP